MQVYLKMTSLPSLSSIGPTFNLIPTPAGPIDPSTITLTELLNGVYVTVNHTTTQIRIESTVDCTSFIDVTLDNKCTCIFGDIDFDVAPGVLCFTYAAETPDIIYTRTFLTTGSGLYNGKPYYLLDPTYSATKSIAVYWDGTQWVNTDDWFDAKPISQILTTNVTYPISIASDWNPSFGNVIMLSVTDGICPTTSTTTTTTESLVNTIYLNFSPL